MSFGLKKVDTNYNIIYIVLIILALFFIFLYPIMENRAKGRESFSPVNAPYVIESPDFLNKAKCHPMFCYENRWMPTHMFYSEKFDFNPSDYEASNLSCITCEHGTGCLGLPKKELNEFRAKN